MASRNSLAIGLSAVPALWGLRPESAAVPLVHATPTISAPRKPAATRESNLGRRRGDLEIRYTGLSFDEPENVRFRCKLEGYDEDWIDVGVRRTAYYTKLPPGEYSFSVRTCNIRTT